MNFKKFSRFALCSVSLLSASMPIFAESKINFSGAVQSAIDYTSASGARRAVLHLPAFGGRLTAASKKMGSDTLWGSGVITGQYAPDAAGAVTTREAFLKFGGDNWDLVFGRYLVAKFTDFSGDHYDGFFISKHGALTYATNYEVLTVNGRDGKSIGLHLNPNENMAFELSLHSGTTAAAGAVPATQDYGFRPHLGLTFENIKILAAMEWVSMKDNDVATVGAADNYERTIIGGGLGVDASLNNLTLGLSAASMAQDGRTTTNVTADETEKVTLGGKIYFQVNEGFKMGTTINHTTGELKPKETGSVAIEDEETAWLVDAGFTVAEGTLVSLGYSGSKGERKTNSTTTEHDSSQIKAQLDYAF